VWPLSKFRKFFRRKEPDDEREQCGTIDGDVPELW
jgi:hypothetical protein